MNRRKATVTSAATCCPETHSREACGTCSDLLYPQAKSIHRPSGPVFTLYGQTDLSLSGYRRNEKGILPLSGREEVWKMAVLFGKPALVKSVKIALGCALAVLLAREWGLQYPTSVATITLLSIQNTKRDTFLVAARRCAAFFCALSTALPSFFLLRFSIPALGAFLLLFVPLCQWLRVEEGLAMSVVLMLHLWSSGSVTIPSLLNEAALMAIGILMGILVNLFMPRRWRQIRRDQQITEDRMRDLLRRLSLLLEGTPDRDQTAAIHLEELRRHLEQARIRALHHADNTFQADMRYFLHYVDMRLEQWRILRRLYGTLGRLAGYPLPLPWQAASLAAYLRDIAASLQESNNALALLEQLGSLRCAYRRSPLPATREEFEIRAILYEAADEIHRLLLRKREFALSLTPTQVQRFWGDPAGEKESHNRP